jgi:hypothetical protein
VFVVGLSDEAGAGSALAMAVALGRSGDAAGPDPAAVAQLATYVNRTLWGTKLDGTGVAVSVQQPSGGVRASMFYSGQPSFKYNVSGCWDRPRSETLWRSVLYISSTIR